MNYLSYRELFEMLRKIEALCETMKEFAEVANSIPDMGWTVEKKFFLKLVFEPIWSKCNNPEGFYSWIAEKRLGVNIFWTDDELWDWLRKSKSDYILKDDADILFKNVTQFLNRKIAA